MNEQTVAQRILTSMLGTAQELGARQIRIINLSVYDPSVDTEMFTRTFETLAHGTIAEEARVRLRPYRPESLAQLTEVVFAKLKADAVCLDSIELG